MAKKFYAVKKGKTPGIYETWAECQTQISGYSGAEYKGFASLDEAKAYINNERQIKAEKIDVPEAEAIAYVDGSYNAETNQFSCGVVLFHLDKEQHFAELFDDIELAEMNNVAGEIKGSEKAIQYCLDNGIKSLTIYHDYEGIAKWCTGDWQAKKIGTKAYKEFFDEASKKVEVHFIKVKGHSGDKYNDVADRLAKSAFLLEPTEIEKPVIKREQKLAKKKGVFIERNDIQRLVTEAGNKQWASFEASELVKKGNPYRCTMVAAGKTAMLDFYFNGDGTTTITPTGANSDMALVIKVLLEEGCTYSNSVEGKTHTLKNLSKEWADKLIEYLSSLVGENIVHQKIETHPVHDLYKFTGSIGDTLTINIYNTGTVTLQGKPAYLYGEAISFLSYCDEISVDDIINTVNSFHNVNVKISDVRNEMETLLPRAYGNINNMILKLLSPSISLRRVKIDLEDYSCYAFPALRALEGYIKYLFGIKGVTVGYTFYKIFNETSLTPEVALQVGDATYQAELERLYTYFRSSRHVRFHTEQVLIGTDILEDKQEADEIVNTVLNLIETSYTNINK